MGRNETDTRMASILLMIIQVVCWIGFAYAEYGVFDAAAYDMYIGVALMMLVGFGYLMTFLQSYGLGAVGFTFIITAVAVQINLLLNALIPNNNTLVIDALSLMDGNFAAACILISFGCMIGKASPCQLVVLTVMESVIFQVNRNYFCLDKIGVEDAGGSILVHMFGAYFGLAAARVLGQPKDKDNLEGTSATSDILSLVGTVFLWLYWPSFNGGALTGDTTHAGRAVANTVLGLLASCVSCFIVSGIVGGRFTPADIQNASLAGGVAVGAVARCKIGTGWASALGALGGVVSTLGYQFVQPFLKDKIGLHDSCGVHNLHGMPALISGLASLPFMEKNWEPWMPHAKGDMAIHQLLTILVSLGVAIVGGAFTGWVLKIVGNCVKSISVVKPDPALDATKHFDDANYWNVANVATPKVSSPVSSARTADAMGSVQV